MGKKILDGYAKQALNEEARSSTFKILASPKIPCYKMRSEEEYY